MKWKDVLKGVVIGVFIAVTALTLGRCTHEATAATSDWKQCETEIVLHNSSDQTLTYNIDWIDHDLDVMKNRNLPRCGGEIAAHGAQVFSEEFRLCLGKHVVTFWTRGLAKIVSQYEFMVEPNTPKMIITLTVAIPIHKVSQLKPEVVGPAEFTLAAAFGIDDIREGLVKEEAIKQILKDNFQAFTDKAEVTRYGKSVILHTSITEGNIIYTMSVRGIQQGLISIDFTKQVTILEGVVNIYYEGINGTGYYCYAKQLWKKDNCRQVNILSKSIFEQNVVMLFKGGEVA